MRKWVYGLDEAFYLIDTSFIFGEITPGAGSKPGYAFMLGIIFIILNTQHPFFIRLLTVIFTSFLPFVGYSFGKKLGGEKIGWLTGLFLVFHHKIFDLSYWIMTDIPFTFLTFLSIYFILLNFEKLENSESNKRFPFIAGILCGLSDLVRQIGIYLIFLTILLYFLTNGINLRQKFDNAIRFFMGVTSMLLPWFLWSYIHLGVLDPTLEYIATTPSSPTYITLFSRLLYYVVQIPGMVLGFHLINQYQVTFSAIIISIGVCLIIIIGLVNGYSQNKLLTRITILSTLLLLIFLVILEAQVSRYFYPIIPLLVPFLFIGLFKTKDIMISAIKYISNRSTICFKKKGLFSFHGKFHLLINLMFIAAILLPNIVADTLANKNYLSTDDMVVTSPLWRAYIEAALWVKETSDPQDKVITFKNFDFEYYSQRKCIAPSRQIYSEYFRNNKHAYVTELMNYMYTNNITHVVIGPFGYTDNILFWLSDPNTAPSYVEVIYLRNSPKVIIYLIQWSKFTIASPFN